MSETETAVPSWATGRSARTTAGTSMSTPQRGSARGSLSCTPAAAKRSGPTVGCLLLAARRCLGSLRANIWLCTSCTPLIHPTVTANWTKTDRARLSVTAFWTKRRLRRTHPVRLKRTETLQRNNWTKKAFASLPWSALADPSKKQLLTWYGQRRTCRPQTNCPERASPRRNSG